MKNKHTHRQHAKAKQILASDRHPTSTTKKTPTEFTQANRTRTETDKTGLLVGSGTIYVSFLPSLFTVRALVEAGHGLVRGAQLHHQEERLLVVTERACRLHAAG